MCRLEPVEERWDTTLEFSRTASFSSRRLLLLSLLPVLICPVAVRDEEDDVPVFPNRLCERDDWLRASIDSKFALENLSFSPVVDVDDEVLLDGCGFWSIVGTCGSDCRFILDAVVQG